MTLESKSGFVRVVARRDNHCDRRLASGRRQGFRIVHRVCAKPGNGRALEDIGGTIHAHPTLGEAVQEAALRAGACVAPLAEPVGASSLRQRMQSGLRNRPGMKYCCAHPEKRQKPCTVSAVVQ
jgi:hypothetical protein